MRLIVTSLICLLSVTAFAYQQPDNKAANDLLLKKIAVLKTSMLDYMKSGEASYKTEDVDKCAAILTTYIKAIAKTNSGKEGMGVVKQTVLALNKLQEACDERLIETSEREQIAEIIIKASSLKGYNTINEDITEQWRTW